MIEFKAINGTLSLLLLLYNDDYESTILRIFVAFLLTTNFQTSQYNATSYKPTLYFIIFILPRSTSNFLHLHFQTIYYSPY